MGGDFLLDTNILIAFLKQDHEIVERVASAVSIAIPFVVVVLRRAELLSRGRERGAS